jgi:hypothetical protein
MFMCDQGSVVHVCNYISHVCLRCGIDHVMWSRPCSLEAIVRVSLEAGVRSSNKRNASNRCVEW